MRCVFDGGESVSHAREAGLPRHALLSHLPRQHCDFDGCDQTPVWVGVGVSRSDDLTDDNTIMEDPSGESISLIDEVVGAKQSIRCVDCQEHSPDTDRQS